MWPTQPNITTKNEEILTETKLIKEVTATTIIQKDKIDKLLNKFTLTKTTRILAWIYRFMKNSRGYKCKGPITTEEIAKQRMHIIKTTQQKHEETEKFKQQKTILNLVKNSNNVYECQGRIQGDFPIFVPCESILAEKIVEEAHINTLHGGVVATMTKVRENIWIPKLRQTTKAIIKRCYGCKKFHTSAYPEPKKGPLPLDRTTQDLPFKIIGTDYAGPFTCKVKNSNQSKRYLLLFTCSLTRAVHLELVQNQTTTEFIKTLKRLIARRGCPRVIYSDNAKTFVAASRWVKRIKKDEEINQFLSTNNIVWKFNLSRAPWWGGQFERIVGLVKQCLYKTVGRANLTVKELEEVILDIEVNLNNRPLTYLEEDIEYPVLTPNILIHGQKVNVLEEVLEEDTSTTELRKRYRYIVRCKNAAWERWKKEYLKALRERHNFKNNTKTMSIKVGDVVMIKGDDKN